MAVYKRGNVWWYEFQIDGERHRGTTKERTKSRATQFEAEMITHIRENGSLARRRPITLELWAKQILNHYTDLVKAAKRDSDTERYYRNGWRLLSQTKLAKYRLDRITSDDANVLVFPGGPSNANCALRTLRRLLHAAVERGRLMRAPKIATVEETERTRLVEPWMEELLLQHALKLGLKVLHDVLVSIFDSGMRPEEVLRARSSQLLWERNRVLVAKHKTSADSGVRYVPFTDRMQRVYADFRNAQNVPLYPSKRAKCGHRVTIAKQWAACVASVNAERLDRELPLLPKDLVPYCGRHTFATDLLKDSKNLRLVQKALGHKNITTTMRYLHPEDGEAVEVINARNRRRVFRIVNA